MILFAFFALKLNGKDTSISVFWHLEYAASNHMTNSSDNLIIIKKYDDDLTIQTAYRDHLSITALGDISYSPSLQTIFYSRSLFANLFFFGQLVDTNCSVSFSRSSCIM